MNTLTQLSLLVGAALPLLVAVINRCDWEMRTKALSAFAACVVAAGLTAVVAGELTAENWGTALVGVLVAAHTTYSALYKPTGLADSIEVATTRQHGVQEPLSGPHAATEGNDPHTDGEGLTEPYSAANDADAVATLNARLNTKRHANPWE